MTVINPQVTRRTSTSDVKRITASAGGADTLTVLEQNVDVTVFSSGTHTITLPGAEEASERTFIIYALDNDTGTVTVVSPEPSATLSRVLTAADDYVICYSSGYRWYVIKAVIAGSLVV